MCFPSELGGAPGRLASLSSHSGPGRTVSTQLGASKSINSMAQAARMGRLWVGILGPDF